MMSYVINKNYYFLALAPLLYNFFNNIYDNKIRIDNIGIYDFISSLLIFSFLFLIGYCFKSIFNNMTITFGIIVYIFSFFILEIGSLFFYKNMNLNLSFIITNTFWVLLFFFLLKNKKLIAAIFGVYFLMHYFNSMNINLMNVNYNLIGDVKDIFYPNTLKIYGESYKSSVIKPIMSGYPQFMSYIDALIFKISFGEDTYKYVASNSLLFFWLNLLLFSELKTSRHIKAFIILIFTILLLNSTWLQFLFVSSLMSERIAGYLMAGILITLLKNKNFSLPEICFIFFILSFIYNTKQFFSLITLILFFIFLFNQKYKNGAFFIFSALVVRELSYFTYFLEVPRDHHLRQIDVRDTITDLLLFRDLKITNLIEITKNLWIDKPMTYILLLTFTLFIIASYKNKTSFELNIFSFVSILNVFLILILYISVWRDMELESPVRYIYSFLIFYLIIISESLDALQNKYSNK
jgi:hypothetical protein